MKFESLQLSDWLQLALEDDDVVFLVADEVFGRRQDNNVVHPNVALGATGPLPELYLIPQFLHIEYCKALHDVTRQDLVVDCLDHVEETTGRLAIEQGEVEVLAEPQVELHQVEPVIDAEDEEPVIFAERRDLLDAAILLNLVHQLKAVELWLHLEDEQATFGRHRLLRQQICSPDDDIAVSHEAVPTVAALVLPGRRLGAGDLFLHVQEAVDDLIFVEFEHINRPEGAFANEGDDIYVVF